MLEYLLLLIRLARLFCTELKKIPQEQQRPPEIRPKPLDVKSTHATGVCMY